MGVRRLHEADFEDVRLAVVMNGGVSLAVWIGGVTLEINRLTNARAGAASVYGGLLNLIQGRARVDVISGTSAGGINGAFLALAAAYGQDLSSLGDLWARRGDIGALLRSPLEKAPPSLMRGDDYFLPALAAAFEQVHPTDPAAHYRSPDDAPIDLTITTSIVAGEPRVFYDDFGTPIAETDHSGEFHFRRDAMTPARDDPFRHPQLTSQLALAARSTASFPFAFEASWCPVQAGQSAAAEAIGVDEHHPNMAGIADFDHSRYVVDGGVLLNKPVVPALKAIRSQPASRQVRRILCYVNPDPGDEALQHAADRQRGDRPALARTVISSLFTMPMAQSIDAALDELQERNEQARDRKESRLELIAGLGGHADALAGQLYPMYRVIRRRRAFAAIADLVIDAAGRSDEPVGGPTADAPAWTREDVIAALDQITELPFVPDDDLVAALDPSHDWSWGLAAVERLGYLAVDVLRRAMWVAPVAPEDDEDTRSKLRALRGTLHEHLRELRELRQADVSFWRGRSLPAPPGVAADRPDRLRTWAAGACAAWAQEGSANVARDLAERLSEILVQTRRACRSLPAPGSGPAWVTDDRALLDGLLSVLVPGASDDTATGGSAAREEADAPHAGPHDADAHAVVDAVLDRLLKIEIATLATGVSSTAVDQVVDLIQISANGDNSFDAPESARKLAGVKLGHFAAFYKKSWRVNDWVWGRVDGATRLVRAVLAPARLRQLGYSTDEALEAMRTLATACDDDADAAALAAMFEQERCRDELTFLSDDSHPMPPSLPACAMAVARRLHLGILRAHLHELADAVQHDVTAGASSRSNGVEFRNSYRAAVSRHPDGLPADTVFALFRDAELGEETVQQDIGSDLFANTVSTATAVTASTFAGDEVPKPLRAVGRALRGVTMLLYAMVRGTAMGSTAAALVTIALGVGGACLAVFLLTRATPPLVPFVGVMVLLAGLALASLRGKLRRQGWYLIAGVVVTFIAGVLIAWLVPMVSTTWRPLVENVLVLVGVVALVLGTMALGGIDEIRRGDATVDESEIDERPAASEA